MCSGLTPRFKDAVEGRFSRAAELGEAARPHRFLERLFGGHRAEPFWANEFGTQHNTEAAENVRPTGLKFSATSLPAIGSTSITEPDSLSVS